MSDPDAARFAPTMSSPVDSPVRKVVVVLNPVSGRGTGARRRSELEELLSRESESVPGSPAEWSIVETTRQGSGIELAAKGVADGADVVAAAGGDGTYGEVANGIVGTSARLGIIPLGTGNDFARALGIQGNLPAAIQSLFHGVPRSVDLGKANGRWFINVAGCGFDAVVAARVNHGFRWLRGTSAYVAAILQCLVSLRAAELRLTVDGVQWDTRGLLCSVANSECYGGGMRITPGALIDDGLFDICVLGEAGRIEFLRVFPRVFSGTHVTHPKVTLMRAKELTVESSPPLPILIDGDVIGRTPVTFTIHKHAIQVMAPVRREEVRE